MTYDLEQPGMGNVNPLLSQGHDNVAVPTVVANDSHETTTMSFELNDPVQRFLAGRHWLAEGDAVFVNEVQNLSRHGWLPNDRNEHGDALLHVAVRSARWASVEWLMSQGADPMLTNNHGHTPVWLARRRPLRHLPTTFRALVETAKNEGLLDEPAPSSVDKPVRPAKRDTAPAKSTHEKTAAQTKASSKVNVKDVPSSPARPPRSTRTGSDVERSLPAIKAPTLSADAERFTVALDHDDRATLMQMLTEGFDMTGHNPAGNTVLHETLARNTWEWTDRLINYGAPLLAKDRSGKSVLDHVEARWSAQDPEMSMERYDTFQDALADEKALQRVALGQGLTRSTKSLFKEKVGVDIDWKGLPQDPDRPERAQRVNPSKPSTKGPMKAKASPHKTAKPYKNKAKSNGSSDPTSAPRARRSAAAGTSFAGKSARKNNGQPNPLVTGMGHGSRRSSLDRPLREVSEYNVPKGATLAPNVVIVRKVRRVLMKP